MRQHSNILLVHSEVPRIDSFPADENAVLTTEKDVKNCQNGERKYNSPHSIHKIKVSKQQNAALKHLP